MVSLQRHRVNPGRAKLTLIHAPLRDRWIEAGVYRPCNRVRQPHDPTNKPLHLARRVPFLARHNYTRS